MGLEVHKCRSGMQRCGAKSSGPKGIGHSCGIAGGCDIFSTAFGMPGMSRLDLTSKIMFAEYGNESAITAEHQPASDLQTATHSG